MYPIVPEGERTTEKEAQLALLGYLETKAYGEADFKSIFFELNGKWLTLTKEDKVIANKRKYEPKWHSVVRNIGSKDHLHPGNAIFDGLLVARKGGGYQLASRVKKYA
jgi:hypothetical protein